MKRLLLVIDIGPLIREAESELARLGCEIRVWEQAIRDYETLDVPAFEQWKNLVCADLLSRRRELHEELRFLRSRLTAIYRLAGRGDWSEGEAYFWFHQIETGSEEVPPGVRRVWESVDGPTDDGPAPFESAEGEEEDEATGQGQVDQSSLEGDEAEGPLLKGEGNQRRGPASLQFLYRKVVRQLHPDVAGTLSGDRLELWHRAQAAYEAGDVLTLELILARCTPVRPVHLSYSQLLELVADARTRLESLQQVANGLAATPAWRFREGDSLARHRCEGKVRDALEAEICELQRERHALEQRLARMRDRAERWAQNESDRPLEMA